MARAQFQKGQKVWVESVGVWAQVEKVMPVWAKGFDEPVRITYDVGLGREFRHPYPGSYPVVVTDKADWGGWRVPGAEYDRDPQRIEFQARLIAAGPDLMDLARELMASVAEAPDDAPPETQRLARKAQSILRRMTEIAAPAPASRPDEDAETDA
jgi:hypothetical protein